MSKKIAWISTVLIVTAVAIYSGNSLMKKVTNNFESTSTNDKKMMANEDTKSNKQQVKDKNTTTSTGGTGGTGSTGSTGSTGTLSDEENMEQLKEEYPNWIEGVDIRDYIEEYLDGIDKYGIINVDEGCNVCVRNDSNSESAKKIGLIANEGFVEILDEETNSKDELWYKVKSGDVEGYILSDYVKTGEDAEELVKKVGYLQVEMKEKDAKLNVRAEESTDSDILTQIVAGEGIVVKSATDEWVEVEVPGEDDETGYVSREYAKFSYCLKTASEVEEKSDTKSNSSSNGNSSSNNSNSSNSSNSSSNGTTGEDVVAFASKFIGNPYVYGGTDINNGIDCSAFVQYVYKNFGVSLPRTSREQAQKGKQVSNSDLQPGDLVFNATGGRISHVAIYAGNGQIVEAANEQVDIVKRKMWFTPCKAVRVL